MTSRGRKTTCEGGDVCVCVGVCHVGVVIDQTMSK